MFQRLLSGLISEAEPQHAYDLAKAVNTACIITIVANSQRAHWATKISWSYDADPVTGLLTVEDGAANFIERKFITKGGPGSLMFGVCKGTSNTAMIITLGAVAGVKGTLRVEYLTRA